MTAFSLFVLPKKSLLIEKNRFNKHCFIKQEGKFYIFARQQASGILEGSRISEDYWNFIHSISKEADATIYFLIKELKNRESEHDFSITNYLDRKGDIDSKKAVELTKETLISYGLWYKYPFIHS